MSAACVAVRVVDVHAVVHDDRGAARPAIPARAVPGNVRFSRSQRAPADAAESGPDARPNDMVEAEERDERGSPGVAEPRSARIPPPAVARVAIPPSPVVGSPAPGFVADPTPAVIVQPDPTAMPVRDPSDGDAREPAVADARYVPPRPMVVKRFRPVNIAAEVAVRPGAAQTLVPIDRPPVEIVLGPSAAGRGFRPIQALAHDHCPAALENLRAGLEGDFRFALPDRDDRFVGADLDPIATGLAGPHRHQGRFDVDIGLASRKLAVENQPLQDADPKPTTAQLQQLDLRVIADPQEVAVIQLNLGSRAGDGLDRVAFNQRHVDHRGDPVPRISAHGRDVSIHDAHASDAQRRTARAAVRHRLRRRAYQERQERSHPNRIPHGTEPPSATYAHS